MNAPIRTAPALVLLLALAVPAPVARAQDPIVVRPSPDVPAPVAEGRVDHGAWDALLRRYVDARGLVDYAAWKAADRPALERYLVAMAAVRPDALADRDERLAYWINVYNALTVHGMLRFYPTKSIREHVSRFWGFHFWDDVRIEVAGAERSLDAIEHAVLRPMGEPRIHFAIVCASIGCPKLRNEAYVGTRLDAAPAPAATPTPAGSDGDDVGGAPEDGAGEAPDTTGPARGQLDDQAGQFFDDPSKFRIDRERGTVWMSAILDWFGKDFGGTDRARLDFAARYVRSAEDRTFLARKGLDVEFLDYDWGINDRRDR